jgi:hypothetical protein
MHQIIYISQAQEGLTLTSLVVLLMQARAFNERANVTGALVYGDGQFLQVLEGEEAVLQKIYARVVSDKRHFNVRKLADGPVAGRYFARWTMAFGEVPAAQFEALQKVAAYQTPAQLAAYIGENAPVELLLTKMKELIYPYPQA